MKQPRDTTNPAPNGSNGLGTIGDRLSAIADPLRLRLCRLLEREELSVGEVANVVQLPQSTVSRRLKGLADAGWLLKRPVGTATFYRLHPEGLDASNRDLWAAVRSHLTGDGQFREDDRRLEAVLADRSTDSLAFFGRVGGEWNEVRAQLFGRGFTSRALLGLIDQDWVIADLGCGTGDAAEELAPHVREVVAVDQAQPMLDAARRRLSRFDNIRFQQGHLESLPIEDASVDAAVTLLVLHHVEEPAAALREMQRVVRPGGAALILDMTKHDREIYQRTMGHKHLGFSADEATGLLTEAGFERVRYTALLTDADAKGPGLFVATGRKGT